MSVVEQIKEKELVEKEIKQALDTITIEETILRNLLLIKMRARKLHDHLQDGPRQN